MMTYKGNPVEVTSFSAINSEIVDQDGHQYWVPTRLLETEKPTQVKRAPRKTRLQFSDYKISHNMRPYLADAIGRVCPRLIGVFTEKEKSINESEQKIEQENAARFLELNPAFLVLVDTLISRGISKPFGIQLPVEIYRWDLDTAAKVGFQDADYADARAAQEARWKAKTEKPE